MNNCNTELYADLLEQCKGPEVFLRSMMAWHFSPETGMPFWLNLADKLNFDPVRDIKTFADLKKFPDISPQLRNVRPQELMPRGISDKTPMVCESGGTTGAPKFFIAYDAWLRRAAALLYRQQPNIQKNTLIVMPSGSHLVARHTLMRVHHGGGLGFTIDFDPRWVKYSLQEGYQAEAERYIAHLLRQVRETVAAQEIGGLTTTPPMLRAIMKDEGIAPLLLPNLRDISIGGTQVNLDEAQLIVESLPENATLSAIYGSSSILGASCSEAVTAETEQLVYPGFSPFVTYDVVDAETKESLAEGERGQVVATHISPYAFYPQVFERDTATKLPPLPGMFGCCVADVRPLPAFEGGATVEGVY